MENNVNNFSVSPQKHDACNMDIKDIKNVNDIKQNIYDTQESKPLMESNIFSYNNPKIQQLFDKSASLFQSSSTNNNQAERIRKEMEDRIQNRPIEDDLIEVCQAGWGAVKSLFGKKKQDKEEKEDQKDNKKAGGFLSLS
jgi:hypothetical protein